MTSAYSENKLRLLRTPYPDQNENLPAYLLRLTDVNGYERSSWITGLIDKTRGDAEKRISGNNLYSVQTQLMPGIARITGIPMPLLEPLLDYPDKTGNGSGYRINDVWLASSYLSRLRVRICPKCIQESGIISSRLLKNSIC